MANKVMNKLMGFFGLEDEYDDIEEIENEEEVPEVEQTVNPPITSSNKKQSKVVNIHTASSPKIIITKPTAFEEAANICDELRDRRIVVVNTTELEPKVAQRLLDFMGGASYVLNGELQEVERGVYVLSPSNVEVTNELKSELSSRGIFAWTK
ncbi:cell division protein SepF [Clostridium oryzae]|uniref:Cell division protein SepF n=1 Tax=Clostridium oryzae TaxID=1450648 RepID=A0A1V4IT75_9CLOT|nr:cell division protein SepF [Clostridium oryzae]OPJ63231.1 cell division protein SepF [Clostridium oryzae]